MGIFLEDLADLKENEVKNHISVEYAEKNEAELRKELNKFKILIVYESVGSWGRDSSSFFLIQSKKNKELFEVHGSHCSCYGFEGQWSPKKTSIEYLKSDKFSFSTGGYDSNETLNEEKVHKYMKRLR